MTDEVSINRVYTGIVHQAKDNVIIESPVHNKENTVFLEAPMDLIEHSLKEYIGKTIELEVTLRIRNIK